MKKVFTLLTLALLSIGSAWAGTAIIGPGNMTSQKSGTMESTADGNVWFGNGTNLATGFIIQITGNKEKAFSNQGTVTINGTATASFKNSNGAQNTITLPSGSYASSVTFYVTANADADAKLSECNGTSCDDAVTSHKDGAHPTVITKTLGGKNSFTFTFSSKQVLFVAVVTYDQPTITTQPVSATYEKDEAASAMTVAATASNGDLTYQWFSCDDEDKTNATSVSGATNASFTPSTSADGTFYYFCRVTDSKGSTDSDVATVTVSGATAPTISAEASATKVCQNASVTLTATITGVPVPTIQWYSCTDAEKTGAEAIDGATSDTYSPSTAAIGTYYFYAVATNSAGNATSNVVTLTVDPLYTVTYTLGDVTGVTGTVPAAVETESKVTIPANKTLYKDGYTLIAWNDGSADHAIGSEMTVTANTTLTPVFTENAASSYLGHNTTTATWQFGEKNGAPSWNELQGAGQEVTYVTQANVGGNAIDVMMLMDPTNGKIHNSGRADQWAQMNAGTELTVPVLTGAELSLKVYQEGSTAPTFGGVAGTFASSIYSFTATSDGDLTVTIGDQSYIEYLSVTYPSESAVLNVTANNTEIGLTKENINGVDYLAVSTDNWTSSQTIGDYTGEFYNLSSTDRKLTIKVTGAKLFEVFVKNNTADRKYSVKVGDGDATEITHGGTNVESSGVFAIADPTVATTITLSGGGKSVYPAYIVFDPVVTITPAKEYTTFVTTKPLDFDGTGLTAYKATAATTAEVTMMPVTAVPAGTPLVLKKGTEDSYDVPVVASADAITGNLLKASDGVTPIGGTSVYDYILSNGLFYRAEEGVLAAGKAYLHLEDAPADAARELVMSFGDEATGIDSVTRDALTNGKVYNLQGQEVKNAQKGIFIVNGKKVVLK